MTKKFKQKIDLDEIRKKIPTFTCKKGCHDCCGPVPFSKKEWKRVKDKRKATSINCPYIGEKGCDIYEERPMMCRLFGAIEDLRCPHGCRPFYFLSRKEAKEILEAVYKN